MEKTFENFIKERRYLQNVCNDYIKAVNAYLSWRGLPKGFPHLRLMRLKEEERVLPTFTQAQVTLLSEWRPKKWVERRLHTLILTLLDCGLRIEEVLSLHRGDVDLDNLLLLVRKAKGRKERRIPFSLQLRRILYIWLRLPAPTPGDLLFPTRSGGQMLRTNVLRMVKRLCCQLGFAPPERTLHAMRHTMGTTYI